MKDYIDKRTGLYEVDYFFEILNIIHANAVRGNINFILAIINIEIHEDSIDKQDVIIQSGATSKNKILKLPKEALGLLKEIANNPKQKRLF